METAELLAANLGASCESRAGLHEHSRHTVPLFDTESEFQEHIRQLFRDQDNVVFGEETASAARKRFTAAVEETIAEWENPGPAVIVAHGTVISLLVGHQ